MSEPMFGPSRLPAEMRAALGARQVPVQRCMDCGHRQYPPREICSACLSGRLEWRHEAVTGTVAASTLLHVSLDDELADLLPASIAMIRLESGPKVLAWVTPDAAATGTPVTLTVARDPRGESVLVALPVDDPPQASELGALLHPASEEGAQHT